jgi:hypothetical protein
MGSRLPRGGREAIAINALQALLVSVNRKEAACEVADTIQRRQN